MPAGKLLAEIRPVRDIQKALDDQGFDVGAPDGIWGARSVAALKGFQRAHGLAPSGVVTQDSLRALFPAFVASTLPPSMHSQDAVPGPTLQKLTAERLSREPMKVPTRDVGLKPATSAPTPTPSKKEDGSGYLIVAVIFGVFVLWGRSRKTSTANGRRRASR
ncbi:peptidoglycan-binding domain-containing protein [Rhizobium etli]|uniref:peptidoglycan-binding domain-containing protein n=1 Tax=Rhizobium etli TaxID=29449 RepID=UPI003CC90A73